jgi:hypothetical protein
MEMRNLCFNSFERELEMAKKNSPVEQEAPARTEPVDVTPENGLSLALAAAYRGLHLLFGITVGRWIVNEDGIFAEDVTAFGGSDVMHILNDVARNVKRPQLWPTIGYIMGSFEPTPFVDSAEITVFMTQNFKGADEEGTSKTPAYVLAAAKDYKVRTNTVKARGPKPKTLNLKNLSDVNIEQILASGVSRADLEAFIATATAAVASQPVEATA